MCKSVKWKVFWFQLIYRNETGMKRERKRLSLSAVIVIRITDGMKNERIKELIDVHKWVYELLNESTMRCYEHMKRLEENRMVRITSCMIIMWVDCVLDELNVSDTEWDQIEWQGMHSGFWEEGGGVALPDDKLRPWCWWDAMASRTEFCLMVDCWTACLKGIIILSPPPFFPHAMYWWATQIFLE